MSKKLKHCCHIMDAYAEKTNNRDLIDYIPEIRSYSFLLHENNELSEMQHEFWYCPWCGTELPKELDKEWGEVLKEKYNLTTDDFFNKKGKWDETRVPEEMRTDEWWKKRGL